MATALTEAQLFLTRRCQLACLGCNVVRGVAPQVHEMTDEGWVMAASRLSDLGIKTVKILGGEPTLHKSLLFFVQALSSYGIKTALLTNGLGLVLKDEANYPYYAKVYEDLAPYLHAVFPSVDAKKSPFAAKNNPGWQVIEWAKLRGIPLVAANVSIGSLNMDEVYDVVADLVGHGCRVNLSAYNYLREGEKQDDFHFRMAVPKAFQWKFTEREMDRFGEVIDSLVEFSDHIAGGKEYLRKVARYGMGQSWECVDSNQLRLDADGTVMLCLDKSMPNPMHILQEWGWDEYHSRWGAERDAVGKCSCSWSSPMLAEQRARNGTEDMAERA
jgi:MoaA/NifB/PqqE/SkfB family radical SAM enzyme